MTKPLRVVEIPLETAGDRYRAIDVPEYGPPETITVADLRAGDFVVEFPAQGRIRAAVKSSAVAEIEERRGDWASQSRPRAPKFPIASRLVRFADRRLVPLNVPNDCSIVVRRPVGGDPR